ncbi:MAG: cupin domain-containing protein [Acidimicrobiales bacterium]
MGVEWGSLGDGAGAPETGERTESIASGPGWRIEQILSGRLDAPVDDVLDHPEWALVLDGAAELEVDGVPHSLGPGDWVLLDADLPHRVLTAAPGTRWLTVHMEDPSGQAH